MATFASSVGVTGSGTAICQLDRRSDQFEVRVITVLGVAENFWQRDVEQPNYNVM